MKSWLVPGPLPIMRVRLVKKLAEKIDGVDLSGHTVGSCLQVEERDGQLLVAEGWAVPTAEKKPSGSGATGRPPSEPPFSKID